METKTYFTRIAKHPARIYARDGQNGTVHGAINRGSGWESREWNSLLKHAPYDGTHPYDLIEVKPRIVQEPWMNLYHHAAGSVYGNVHPTRANADQSRAMNCIACVRVPIDCEEGEGLNDDA